MNEECLIELPPGLVTVSQVRSTLLQSSLNSLKNLGHFENYLELLNPLHKDVILGSLAPEWLSLAAAEAHYEACDALKLSAEQMQQIGEDVGSRIQGTFLGTLVRRARTVGLTPWLPLAHFQRLWVRLMVGGGVALYKTGPKDVRVEIHLLPLARYAYFRVAFCGVISAGIKLGAGRAVSVRLGNAGNFEHRLVLRSAWV